MGLDKIKVSRPYARIAALRKLHANSKFGDALRRFLPANLEARSAAVGARIVGGFAGAVFVQQRRAGMAHDVGVGLGQDFDIVTGGNKMVDQVAVEAGLQPQRRFQIGRASCRERVSSPV